MTKEQKREYDKEYRKKNKELINEKRKEYLKQYRKDNKERINENKKRYNDKNKIKNSESFKKYYELNKERLCKNSVDYTRERLKNDSLYKLKFSVRSLIKKAFKNSGTNKKNKTVNVLGCSFEDFKTYLESKFEPWMTWDNKGLYNGTLNFGWDIDHIKPLSSVTNEIDLYKLNHYTNLQPLCSYTNRYIKKDKTLT